MTIQEIVSEDQGALNHRRVFVTVVLVTDHFPVTSSLTKD